METNGVKKIVLKKLTLNNFKGTKFIEVDFNDITSIIGANRTGKTTLFDAFTWLLFGKDHLDRKEFDIKTLDSKNVPKHKLEHEVIGVLDVDGRETTLKRVYKEKWVKRRGELETEFTGHETLFYVDEVPLQAKEYKEKVETIMDEELFKLITSPTYFNYISWQKRRDILFDMIGEIKDSDIIKNLNGSSEVIENILNQELPLEEYRKKIAARKRKLKDDIEAIPTRIDEINRNIPETKNFSEIEKEIKALDDNILSIDSQIEDKGKANDEIHLKNKNIKDQIYDLQNQLQERKIKATREASDKFREYQDKIDLLNRDIQKSNDLVGDKRHEILTLKTKITEISKNNESLREQWNNINTSRLEFNDDEFICPACKRPFEADDIKAEKEAMTIRFNADKISKLEDISKKGKENSELVNNLEKKIGAIKNEIKEEKTKISSSEKKLNELKGIPSQGDAVITVKTDDLDEKINELESKISAIHEVDTSELKEEKRSLIEQRDSYKKELALQDIIEKSNSRIKELEDEEKNLAQQIADIEKEEFAIDSFIKTKIETVEDKVNSKFSFVKFKMFDQQINGGETETCETLINGVPFSGANTGGQIKAGIDIINTLSQHYNIYAPVFIDNRESVTDEINCNSQTINLIADKNYKELTIK